MTDGSNQLVPNDGVALVTGASRGIGRAVALRLATAGRPVGLIARNAGAMHHVVQRITEAGGTAELVSCDLAEPVKIRDAIERLRAALGPIRVLINNAGVFLDRPVSAIGFDQWEHILRVNLTAPFLVTQAVWADMVDGGGGIIVNIASKAALQGYVGQSAYAASKAGLLGWGRAVALEGKPHNIRVHTLCPGGVDTDLIAGTSLGQRLAGEVMLRPEDVAEAVQYCVSRPGNVDIPEIMMGRFSS
ncbi:MAG: SDR family oxidoreductase [Phycisphaerae bacterium]|nr:SDR family oxidoreductase [Phycisphaerae bacterium]